jgi:DnaK suppressor protein
VNDRKPQIDSDRAHELLARERARIESSLADLKRVRESELDEIDTGISLEDDAEALTDEQVDDALAEQLRGELQAVERAEKRLEEGTYGLSIESGEPIPARRLEAVPWAERTADEQERHDGARRRG